ncbi:MAG: FxsA family protein [Pseudomonadota bacterium]|nr:FxsA family protein [Pseudomonadota bacterium]
MTPLLLIAFIGIPIIEIAGFITLGSWIGLWWTLGTVLLTAIVGTALVRSQSTSVLARINEQLAVGEIPARALFDGLCLLAAALLLLTPGFFTDAIGIALLLPPVRARIAPLRLRWAQRRGNLSFAGMGGGGSGGFGFSHAGGNDNGRGGSAPNIIDGEAEVVETDPEKQIPPSRD